MKLLHIFIPSKTAALVPEFAVEDLPLGRTVTLVSVTVAQSIDRPGIQSSTLFLELWTCSPYLFLGLCMKLLTLSVNRDFIYTCPSCILFPLMTDAFSVTNTTSIQ